MLSDYRPTQSSGHYPLSHCRRLDGITGVQTLGAAGHRQGVAKHVCEMGAIGLWAYRLSANALRPLAANRHIDPRPGMEPKRTRGRGGTRKAPDGFHCLAGANILIWGRARNHRMHPTRPAGNHVFFETCEVPASAQPDAPFTPGYGIPPAIPRGKWLLPAINPASFIAAISGRG
jgi:hypothetical protein